MMKNKGQAGWKNETEGLYQSVTGEMLGKEKGGKKSIRSFYKHMETRRGSKDSKNTGTS